MKGRHAPPPSFASTILSLPIHAAVASFFAFCNAVSFLFGLAQRCMNSKAKIDYSKQAVVITGCDTGFGELSSRRLSGMGMHVISCCISSAGADRLKGVVGLAVVCDVTKQEDIDQLAKKTEEYLSNHNCKLWGVVNNAGIGNGGAIDWLAMSTMRKVMEVNFFGVVNVTKALLPLLKRNKNSRILNVSSIAGFLSAPTMSAYDASKHAVEGYAKALRSEMKAWNIHVCNINPGFMKTPIVTGGPDLSKAEWAKAADSVKEHYAYEDMPEPANLDNFLEDPQLVVDAIVDGLTDSCPPMWYFPGIQAGFFFRHMTASTTGMMDLLSMVVKVGPQPKDGMAKKLQES